MDLELLDEHFQEYREQLERNDTSDYRIDDSTYERQVVAEIRTSLAAIQQLARDEDWMFFRVRTDPIARELESLQTRAAALPAQLHQKLWELRNEVRNQYRTLIVLVWVASISAAAVVGLLAFMFYHWIFRPIQILTCGSRRVGEGDFSHRIELRGDDEMGELARAMNGMTERFVEIRDDLDRQVQLRTKQVIRSEQLASVGFLAAGVAHEINNPLASIAMCAESLEKRIADLLEGGDERHAVVRNYLRMIQEQAFRCKGITEGLLDFSRLGDRQRSSTDLRELVQGIIEMVRTLGNYRDKEIVLVPGPPVVAPVNPQQLKQVVLNLITNGLDSIDPKGTVTIELARRGPNVELVCNDNGCGMTQEVLEHLFEPFFTRNRSGKGTGLGLSIAWNLVADHGGQIEAHSDGPGRGARFRVTIPVAAQGSAVKSTEKELNHRYQAA